jgi:hypothetical protein
MSSKAAGSSTKEIFMSNLATSTPVINAMAAAVVTHDTPSVISNGSVNLQALGVPSTVTTSTEATSAATNSSDFELLTGMEQQRMSWENNELAASNRRLYSILTQAYGYYCDLKQHTNEGVRKQKKDALTKFINERDYSFMPCTHDMTRVVKCVFGVDRRRVSAYSIALREALRQEVQVADLVAFIDVNGGVEQIRLGFAKPLSATRRAAVVREQVVSNELARIKIDPKSLGADADWVDQQLILVVTYLPTGELVINSVVKNDSAVTSALAAVYSQARAAEREVVRKAKEAEATEKRLAREAVIAANKQKSELKGEAKAAVVLAEAKRLDATAANYSNLFEPAAA